MLATRTPFIGLLFAVAAATGLGGATGCNPNSIGRLCVDPTGTSVTGPKIASPALECPSRLCLIEPSTSGITAATDGSTASGDYRATCTAECSDNGDCEAETKEYCSSGFACAVATDVGSYCCKKICICKDDLKPGFNETSTSPYKVQTPPECLPGGAASSCQNVKQ